MSAVPETTYCAQHPQRETNLRCNRCDRLMCPACAVPTPVGYRCRECVRAHEDRFFSGTQLDYVLVFAICAIGAALARLLSGFLPLLFLILLAIPVGGAIATLALQLSGRRRGRWSGAVAAAGVLAGSLLFALVLGGLGIRTLLLAGILAATVYGRYRVRI